MSKKKNDNLCRKTQLNRQKSAEVIVPKKKKKKKKKWEGPNITARTGSDKFDERATKAENL